MRFTARSIVLFLSTLAAASCGDTITGDDFVVATIDAAFEPATVVSTPSGNPDYQWVASFDVSFVESAGTGATINSISAAVTEAFGGIEIVSDTDEEFQVVVESESNLIPANGSATIGLEVHYTLPGGGTEAIIDVAISILDDNGVEVGGQFQVLAE